jgi:hypothetical protein
MLISVLYSACIEAMSNNTRLEQLCHAFPKLTETNQNYMLGFAEGLMHAQKINNNTQLVKMPIKTTDVAAAFYTCPFGRETSP